MCDRDCDGGRGCRHVCHICKLRLLYLKTKKHYLGMCDVVGECAHTDACLQNVNAGHVFLLGTSCSFFFFIFFFFIFFFLGVCVCVHMHQVNFCKIIFVK